MARGSSRRGGVCGCALASSLGQPQRRGGEVSAVSGGRAETWEKQGALRLITTKGNFPNRLYLAA